MDTVRWFGARLGGKFIFWLIASHGSYWEASLTSEQRTALIHDFDQFGAALRDMADAMALAVDSFVSAADKVNHRNPAWADLSILLSEDELRVFEAFVTHFSANSGTEYRTEPPVEDTP